MLMVFSNVRIMVKCINYLRFYFYNLNYDEFGFNFEVFMEFNYMFFFLKFYLKYICNP